MPFNLVRVTADPEKTRLNVSSVSSFQSFAAKASKSEEGLNAGS